MLKNKFFLGSILLLSFASPLSAQSQIPITIQSDSAEFNYRDRTALHQGHVILKQGERTIYANELTIKNNANGEIEAIIALGQPARYEMAITDSKNASNDLHGHADQLHFFPQSSQIELHGNAKLFHQGDTIEGPKIHYNIESQTLVSLPQKDERTKIILQAKKKT